MNFTELNKYKPTIIIFLFSFITIVYEITISRIFSYILTYHFVFIIIAFSILGHAAGQLYYSKLVSKKKFSPAKYYILLLTSFPLTIALIFLLPKFEMLGTGSTGLLFYIILAGSTFFLIGAICADYYQLNAKQSAILYAADLFGASIGAIASMYMLNNINLAELLTVILLVISICSFIAFKKYDTFNLSHKIVTILFFFLSVTLIIINLDFEPSIAKSADKDLLRIKNIPGVKYQTIKSRWNSFGKTELIKFTYPDSSSSTSMFIDGAAGTKVVKLDELVKDSVKLKHTIMNSGMYFPFHFLEKNEKDSALIIGPGGGYDIAIAYLGRTKFIEAVEVNPTFVKFMKEYNPSTFVNKKNVKVIVREGRNFVKSAKNKYDLIFLTIAITKGVRTTDFINLTENYLFTVEALQDYLNALTEEGRIVLTLHNNEEVYRVISNYLELWKRNGKNEKEAFNNLYVIDKEMNPVLVIKKEPFAKRDIYKRHILSHQFNFDKGISFFPYIKQIKIDKKLSEGVELKWEMFDKILYDVAQGKLTFNQLTQKTSINFNPVTDQSPFFFNYELGIPKNLNILIIAGALLIFWVIFKFKKGWQTNVIDGNIPVVLFNKIAVITFLLGLAYMLIQSYLFQSLNLYLNNPLMSFSLLLFAFLLGNGIGSFLSNYIKENRIRVIIPVICLLLIILFIEVFFLIPNISGNNFELFVLVLVPALFIGIPFPILLLELAEYDNLNAISILLGISGIAGFLGAVITLVIATIIGYTIIFYLSVIIYLGIIFLLFFFNRMNDNKDVNVNLLN